MATPPATVKSLDAAAQPALADELQQAEEDFANGDFVDVTIDQLDRCLAAGKWPWQRERSA